MCSFPVDVFFFVPSWQSQSRIGIVLMSLYFCSLACQEFGPRNYFTNVCWFRLMRFCESNVAVGKLPKHYTWPLPIPQRWQSCRWEYKDWWIRCGRASSWHCCPHSHPLPSFSRNTYSTIARRTVFSPLLWMTLLISLHNDVIYREFSSHSQITLQSPSRWHYFCAALRFSPFSVYATLPPVKWTIRIDTIVPPPLFFQTPNLHHCVLNWFWSH